MFSYISKRLAILRSMSTFVRTKDGTGDDEIDKAIKAAGYSYDSIEDIFYSNIDAWQKNMGYCRLYDEAAAPLGMIIDCEPIYFIYNGKRWLIEFWKGQYGLATGCEIGVYVTDEPDLDISGVFKGPFYNCVSSKDYLQMSYSLKKNKTILLTREYKHWWLACFKLGEFSEPSELAVRLTLTLKDKRMLNAFVKGLNKVGYSDKEITINENTVGLEFSRPLTPQPTTRTAKTDWIIQMQNQLLCYRYQKITGPYDNMSDKIKAIKKEDPQLYESIINIGKTQKLFAKRQELKNT